MRTDRITTTKRTWIESFNRYICGVAVVLSFFGSQLALFGLPLYLYFLAINLILLFINCGMKIVIPTKLTSNKEMQVFVVVTFLMATILLPISIPKATTQPYVNCCLTLLLLWTVYANGKTVEDVEFILKFVFIGLLIVCGVTQYELITGNHFVEIISEYYERMGKDNAFGFQGNINDNATVLVTCLFSALYFLKKQPILMGGVIAWTVYLVYCIGSRMAIIAVLSIVIVAVVVVLLGKVAEYNGSVTKVILYLLILLAAVLLILTIDSSKFLNMISNAQDIDSDATRVRILNDATKTTLKNSFFLGNGSGMTQYLIRASVHSALIEVLCDYGIFAVIPLVVLLAKLLTSFVYRIAIGKKIYITGFAVVFVLMSFCSSSMLRIQEAWIVLALVLRYYHLECVKKDTSALS